MEQCVCVMHYSTSTTVHDTVTVIWQKIVIVDAVACFIVFCGVDSEMARVY